jgi:glucose-6-phosphate 1-dehydrogenase (EC 1.1.1.49)
VIFGGSGDLARRRLVPALYNLLLDGLLPERYAVLGLGRKPLSDQEFRAVVREGVQTFSRQELVESTWADFERHLSYQSAAIDEPDSYDCVKKAAERIEAEAKLPGNRIFYLAIPPTSIAPVCEGLQRAGLVRPIRSGEPYSRVIVEKPIGRDLESARAINATIGRVFDESQTFRIDHYLGKETVQNLMVLRFANSIFEPIWNHKYIDHVQITVSEAEGVGTRATYYDGIRRLAGHDPKPYASTALPGRHGAAPLTRPGRGSRRQDRGVALFAPDPGPGRRAIYRAGSV